MTKSQQKEQRELTQKHGPYPRESVFEESLYIIQNLSRLAPGFTLYTDKHKSYERAVKSFDFQMSHTQIDSRLRRDPSNPLFPINRLHNLYRHYLASQHRETIAFQKHEAALLEKIQLMKIYQNFMKPKFVKKTKFDPTAHERSPAMEIGVASKILEFEEVFGTRRLATQFRLDEREKSFMKRSYPFSRQIIAA